MQIHPIFETNASEDVKPIYEAIKKSLEVQRLPLFFSYMGAFPEYLNYIANQLTENLQNYEFKLLTEHIGNEIIDLIKPNLLPGEDVRDWFSRYGSSPSFYYFLQDTDSIFRTNVKLAFIFVALREAVKGWAIAAKKLPGQANTPKKKTSEIVKQDTFIFQDVEEIPQIVMPRSDKKSEHIVTTGSSTQLAMRESVAIEQDLLPRYLQLCKIDFYEHMKTAPFWELRIGVEKFILNALPLMPHLVFSPINVVIDLTKKYDTKYRE